VFFWWSLWEDSRQEVWTESQINDFLRWILFFASMEITKHDLYVSASVFLAPPTEFSRYSAWNTHLKFYYFGINLFAHYLRLSMLIKNSNSTGVVL